MSLKKTLPENECLVSNCRSEGMRDKKSLDPKIIEKYLNYRKTLKLNKNKQIQNLWVELEKDC
tara:strand:- start:168 stop:356 length:189 start_codon:yes stop_codon:yes gene_type:complete